MVMSVAEFKRKLAQRYDTNPENVIISYGDREFKG